MTAKLLDGKLVSEIILEKLTVKAAKLSKKPTLVVVLVGNIPASEIYINQKEKAASKIGISFQLIRKPNSISQANLEEVILELNKDNSVTGIVVQKPLPKQIDSDEIDCLAAPEKDVDGFNPISKFIPATTRGILELLSFYKIVISGRKVVVVGRSNFVGLPTALEFLQKDATVTICHSKTADLATETSRADILVVAAGKPKLITSGMIKKGAVVVDIGINRVVTSNKSQVTRLVGDVDFEAISKIASYISPVPGGVGPMTVAALMENLVEASF